MCKASGVVKGEAIVVVSQLEASMPSPFRKTRNGEALQHRTLRVDFVDISRCPPFGRAAFFVPLTEIDPRFALRILF